jgi:hypothetical protein
MLLVAALAVVAARAQAEDFYRYVDRAGRVVYTNIGEQVPLAQRESGRLDLSKIPLNSEIGAELDRRFAEKHAELSESSYCQALREAAEDGLLERVWDDFGPLVVCGGVLLGFLLYTPTAMRRFGAPVWAKTLMMAIPSLAIAGVVTFTMTQTNRAVVELKKRVKPCAADTYAKLAGEPDALVKRSQLLDQLQREVARAQAGGYRGPGAPYLDAFDDLGGPAPTDGDGLDGPAASEAPGQRGMLGEPGPLDP